MNQEVDVLQLSHHGAGTDGSTSGRVLAKIFKPKYCIISAHLFSQYNHPSPRVIELVRNWFKDKEVMGAYHFLATNIELSSLEIGEPPQFRISLRREFDSSNFNESKTRRESRKLLKTLHATRYPIYHTGSHGNIVFEYEKDVEAPPNLKFFDFTNKTIDTVVNYQAEQLMPELAKFFSENETTAIPLAVNGWNLPLGRFSRAFQKNSFNSVLALNFRGSGSDGKKHEVKDIDEYCSRYPKLVRFALNLSQIAENDQTSEKLSEVKCHFLDIVIPKAQDENTIRNTIRNTIKYANSMPPQMSLANESQPPQTIIQSSINTKRNKFVLEKLFEYYVQKHITEIKRFSDIYKTESQLKKILTLCSPGILQKLDQESNRKKYLKRIKNLVQEKLYSYNYDLSGNSIYINSYLDLGTATDLEKYAFKNSVLFIVGVIAGDVENKEDIRLISEGFIDNQYFKPR